MRTKFSRQIKKVVAVAIAATMALSVAACGKSGTKDGRTVIYFAAAKVTTEVRDAYLELIKTYNEGQGKEDGVFVQMTENSGGISGLDSALRSNYMYDVIQLQDDEYKSLATQGDLFVNLDDYLDDETKETLDWESIPESLVNRFRINSTKEVDGKFYAGRGAELKGLPIGSAPHILCYNKAILEECGINVVSVPETEMDTYNEENSATLKPHGYAEYKDAPYADAVSGENEAGAIVYKVFNDCIPINWEESRILYRAIQQQYGYEYGFMSEWWFDRGFSIGADCIGWDEASENYVFTLGDKQPGYLALADIEVNGHEYKAGQALQYEDKTFINNNETEKANLDGKIYALPSTYDMIVEFERLGVPADKQVDDGMNGYGVAPSTTQNRTARFTSGTDCPFLIDSYENLTSYKGILGDSLGVAPMSQWRAYEGGSTYTNGGKEYLKVIGETYDGAVYTGDVKVENGTPVVGEISGASVGQALFLPKNTKNKNYDAAVKFAIWVASVEGQKILSKGNTLVPNQLSYGLSDDFLKADERIMNQYGAVLQTTSADIGDYTYFTSLTWITEWSTVFNSDVREGNMKFTDFVNAKKDVADTALKGMNIRMIGR